MRFFAVILLGIAANLDNLCIGMSYGLSAKQIGFRHNLLISGISGIFAFMACSFAAFFNQSISKYTQYVGALMLIFIGLYTIFSALRKKSSGCANSDEPAPRQLSPRDTVMLGVALALNSLACSFAAGLSKIPPLPLGVSVAVLSLGFIRLGNTLGGRILKLCSGSTLDVISGLILVATGVFQTLA